jgi:8-oxo-dGTP pyrophosphatase MutT (NUDIX family)
MRDKMTKLISAGALFKSLKTNRYFFVLRSQTSSYPGRFGLVGGKIHINEPTLQGLTREIVEEIGFMPKVSNWTQFGEYTSSDNRFIYYSLLITTPHEFIPKLNKENDGYAWVNLDTPPKPLHPRLREVLSSDILKDCIKQFK